VWAELALNWAWNDPVCFPNFAVIAEALQFHRNSISKWITELQDACLLEKDRSRCGYKLTLSEVMPVGLVDEDRSTNRKLVSAIKKRKSKKPDPDAVRLDAHQECITEHDSEKPCTSEEDRDAHPVCITPVRDAHQECMVMHTRSACDDEDDVNRSRSNKKRSKGNLKRVRSTSSPAIEENEGSSSTGKIREGTHTHSPNGEQGTYDVADAQPNDPSELMEDQFQVPKNKRRKRAPSEDLVTLTGDGLRTASQPPEGTKTVEATPPPTWKPEDVLALLRGEIEEKYGAKACRGIPRALTSKQRGMLKNAVLAKFDPDVVISMVRVLVWDWEVARTSCFPYRAQIRVPTIEALVQYQETLSAAVSTGLKYDGGIRGSWDTYAARYLAGAVSTDTEDPF
jgi:hypothetical protein